MVKRAVAEAEQDEKYNSVFKYVSYFLYALGWGILFLGKLYDIKDVSGSGG